MGRICFVNGVLKVAIFDGLPAGFVAIDEETHAPTLQSYCRGHNFISIADKKNVYIIRREDVFSVIEGGAKLNITFVCATAHGSGGEVFLHFWMSQRSEWRCAKWNDFKRHLTRSSSTEPILCSNTSVLSHWK